MYTLIIGKFFAADICGLYNQAYKLSSFPSSNFSSIITRAIYPIQCRYQDEDNMLREMHYKYIKMSCYIIFPLMISFCALAEPLVKVFLRSQWLPVVPLLQILCIAFMWDPVMRINNNLLSVKGRSDLFLKAEIYKKVTAFIILFITIPFGIEAMCWGLLIYSCTDIIIITRYTKTLLNVTLKKQIKILFPILILSFTTGFIMYLATLLPITENFQLLTGILTGCIYFIGMSRLFRYEEYFLLLSLIRSKI